MLSKLLLASLTGGLIAGQYFLLKEKKIIKQFNELEKCPSFDFDYLHFLNLNFPNVNLL